MDNKGIYRDLCADPGNAIPVFQQHWWMELVCNADGKQWDVALAHDSQGQVCAAMPYQLSSRLGIRYILQPRLTQYCGPWYKPLPGTSIIAQRERENRADECLIEHIESLRPLFFQQNFSPTVLSHLPFHWHGYRQSTRYTYRLNDISDPDALFMGFSYDERQKKITRLCGQYSCHETDDTEMFADFHKAYWQSRGQRDLLSTEFISTVCRGAIERGSGTIIALYDANGVLAAARFVVYDSRCAYSLLSAYNHLVYTNGISELLVWQTLRMLSTRTKAFDFEGSMDKGIGHFYGSFGSTLTPYHHVTKCPAVLRPLLKI